MAVAKETSPTFGIDRCCDKQCRRQEPTHAQRPIIRLRELRHTGKSKRLRGAHQMNKPVENKENREENFHDREPLGAENFGFNGLIRHFIHPFYLWSDRRNLVLATEHYLMLLIAFIFRSLLTNSLFVSIVYLLKKLLP
jgi:hypothetical protein